MRGRICGQESDSDGGAGEKKERKTEAEVVGHQERLVGDDCQGRKRKTVKWRRLIETLSPHKRGSPKRRTATHGHTATHGQLILDLT